MFNCKTNHRRELRDNFRHYRKVFNRVQKAKRSFWRNKQSEIENFEMNNPKMFWKEIGKLGIGKGRRQSIRMEDLFPDGGLSTKDEDV